MSSRLRVQLALTPCLLRRALRRALLMGLSVALLTGAAGAAATTTMYWADSGEKKIQKAALDGSNVQDVVTGLKVVSHRSMAMSTGSSIGDLEPSTAYRESRKVDTPEADAVFLSGTNWRTIDVIEELEADLKKPVFTANQVTMWATLCKLGVAHKSGFGSVFSYLLP